MKTLKSAIAALLPGKLKEKTKYHLQNSLFNALTKVSGSKYQALLWTYGPNFKLSPYNILLRGYFQGVVPLPKMSDTRIVEWLDPDYRGIIPIEDFKAHKDLIRLLKKNKEQPEETRFDVKINSDFKKTLEACALPRKNTNRTWISSEYIDAALELHNMGIAHSIETYQNGVLVGGVIGYAVNGYFADISLFNTVDNAGKVAYYHLCLKLKEMEFKLHDSGWANSWFKQFGLINMHREEFQKNLTQAIVTHVKFNNSVPDL